jgi:hypothetical protein
LPVIARRGLAPAARPRLRVKSRILRRSDTEARESPARNVGAGCASRDHARSHLPLLCLKRGLGANIADAQRALPQLLERRSA